MGEVHDIFTGERLSVASASLPTLTYESQVEAKIIGDIRATEGVGSTQADVATARKLAQLFASKREQQPIL